MKLAKFLIMLLIMIMSVGMLTACNGVGAPAPLPPTHPAPAETSSDTPSESSESPDTTHESDDSHTASETPSEQEPALEGYRVRVGTLRGPSGMGLAALMEWAEEGNTKNTYHFTLGGSPEEMTAGLISGELDVASLPTNVASVLYQRLDGGIQVLTVGTLGGLFILDRTGEIHSPEDLRGKTINITGQGGIPQFALEHVLRQSGLEPGVDVEIIFNAEHSELASLMIAGRVDIGMLPQPFVTTVMLQSDDIEMGFGLTEAWEITNPGTQFVQGVVVARKEFIEQHPDAVKLFINDHYESVSYVNSNADRAAVIMDLFGIIPENVAIRAIPNSNLVHFDGAEMKPMIYAVLQVLYDANPQTVGGAMPDEEFFFLG